MELAERDAETWYPRRFALLQAFAMMGVWAALGSFFVFGLLEGPPQWFPDSFVLGLAALLVSVGVTALFLYLAFDALKEAIRPRPVLRLDGDGAECAAGRFSWPDVMRVSIVHYSAYSGDGGRMPSQDKNCVRFSLLPGRVVHQPTFNDYSGDPRFFPEMSTASPGARLELRLVTGAALAHAAIDRFYTDRIEHVLGDLQTDFSQ